MSTSIQGGHARQSLDALISELGLIVAADEGAEAQSAQIRAREHRAAADEARKAIEAQRRELKEAQAKAAKPGFLGKALGLAGRVFAALITNGYSLAIEGISLAKSKNGGGFVGRLFGDKANAGFGYFGMLMAPLAGIPAVVAHSKQQSDRAARILRGQAQLETGSIEVDRLRRAMTHDIELAQAANARADGAREDVERMMDALDAAGRSAARSIGG